MEEQSNYDQTPNDGAGKKPVYKPIVHKKEFKLSSWAVDNKMTVYVITAIILIAGVSAYFNVPKESFPEVIIPQIYVTTAYPGNSPEEIEKLITRPLEKEINAISGIDVISSTSIQGFSSIDVKFEFDVTPSEALRKVKDKVDIAMSDPDFPDDLPADPNVFEMNFSELIPIMNVNLSGQYSLDDLQKYAELLEDRIENLPQINKVDIQGIMDKEVRIDLDYLAMEARTLSFGDVAGAISSENLSISGGDLHVGEFNRSVRVGADFKTMDDLLNTIVKSEGGHIVYLRDVADVSFVEKEKESYAREYGERVVSLDIIKRAGENLIDASIAINAIIADAQANDLPEDLEISLTNDQSDQTITQVSELENSIIFGVLLVVGVLLFFLGLRNAAFVGIAIPMSMFMSFLILSSFGVTLNVMVLFSLVLALGMLVDNGIVVVENIYRLMDEGHSPADAAKNGVGEVAWPIIASTATTLAAFIPLAIWPGMMGEFMKYLPITLMIVLSSSLFVALVINPVLTAVLMRVGIDPREKANTVKNGVLMLIIGLLVVVFANIGAPILSGSINVQSMLVVVNANIGPPVALLGFLILVAGILGLTKVVFKKWGGALLILGLITLVVGGMSENASWLGNLLLALGLLGLLNAYVLTPAANRFQATALPWLETKYEATLAAVLKGSRPIGLVVGMIGLFVFSVVLMGIFPPQVDFFPSNEPQYLNIYVEKPIGTDIETTNRISKEIENIVIGALDDDRWKKMDEKSGKMEDFIVTSVIGKVGKGTSDPTQGPSFGNTPHKALITVSFVKSQERTNINTNDILNELRVRLSDYPDAEIVVSKNEAGPPQGAPINLEVRGDDYDSLMQYAEEIKSFIQARNIHGIEELKLDVNKEKPELPITIDRDKARRFGLSTGQIGDAIRTSLFGREISTFKDGEDDYPINMRFEADYRDQLSAILDQKITFRDPSNGRIKQVPVSALATVSQERTFSAVKRKDMDRVITISSNVLEGYNANEVVAHIKSELKDFELPEKVSFSFTGQQEEQAKEMEFLSTAFMIAVFLILLIIVAQFNSISTPVIILMSVFFSLIGVLLGLVIFRMNFVIIMTMIGIISLAGVVVNNAIVLIDYTNLIRERRRKELGLEEGDHLPFPEVLRAIILGGKTRLRPVLLTAITTVLGLLPLAVGFNVDFVNFLSDYDPKFYIGGDNVMFWGPMSWAIIFGLSFATFLTLVIVPVMYLLLAKVKYKLVFKESTALE